VPGQTGLSLQDTLVALTPKGRSHVTMLLERVSACSEDPDEQAAADHVRSRLGLIEPHGAAALRVELPVLVRLYDLRPGGSSRGRLPIRLAVRVLRRSGNRRGRG
jgi:hypothetical protein